MKLNIVFLGLSITSSWGNGHATTYRALIKALAERGHAVTFLERDVPWYRTHRDLESADYCTVHLYSSLTELSARHSRLIVGADLVIMGSYVPSGASLGDWITSHARGVTAFYDIDTPVTLAKLAAGDAEYITTDLIPRFDLYLSFTGGDVPALIERRYGSPCARVLYCSADPRAYEVAENSRGWSLGYLGTYSADRQPALQQLLLNPAEQLKRHTFVVAGASYPDDIYWPSNVERITHLPPHRHAAFYRAQQFTLNITRADMAATGFSPSVRLFEAAACSAPVISDRWPGLETVFVPGREILVADSARDVVEIIGGMSEERRRAIGANARARLLRDHTADHRARELESFYLEARAARRRPARSLMAEA
jgi:spore maturation protein CgeB